MTPAPRCPAITFAGHRAHLLVRCSLPAGHPRDHIPSFDPKESNT